MRDRLNRDRFLSTTTTNFEPTMAATLTEAAAAITAEWAAAWNAHDMSRMAQLLTEDADWVTVAGTHLEGRAQVESVHGALHIA
jgi:ketosteroid isomerase-like protein